MKVKIQKFFNNSFMHLFYSIPFHSFIHSFILSHFLCQHLFPKYCLLSYHAITDANDYVFDNFEWEHCMGLKLEEENTLGGRWCYTKPLTSSLLPPAYLPSTSYLLPSTSSYHNHWPSNGSSPDTRHWPLAITFLCTHHYALRLLPKTSNALRSPVTRANICLWHPLRSEWSSQPFSFPYSFLPFVSFLSFLLVL